MSEQAIRPRNRARQIALPTMFDDLLPDINGEHGEVFTRKWVVELILDLVGYTVDRDLAQLLAVEPACGTGAFLGPLAERLSASCHRHGRSIVEALGALRAYDLLERNIVEAQSLVAQILEKDEWDRQHIAEVTSYWLSVGDYLLTPHDDSTVDFVVGNPPYIRLEDVPDARMHAYRQTCRTMTGRSDIYVGFYDVALSTLRPGGKLGFICADRWMRNQYGRALRDLIAKSYAIETVVEHARCRCLRGAGSLPGHHYP